LCDHHFYFIDALRQSQSCMSGFQTVKLVCDNLIFRYMYILIQNVEIQLPELLDSAITDHKLIIIIVKSANICIHCIYRKSFWSAYAQLGMLGAIFAKVPVIALTATVTEQTKCYTYYCCYYVLHFIQSSLGMVRIQKSLQ